MSPLKIDSFSIRMQSRHYYVEAYSKQESLVFSGARGNSEQGIHAGGFQGRDILDLSNRALRLLADQEFVPAQQTTSEPVEIELKLSSEDEQKLLFLQKMIEKLTGKKLKFHVPKKIRLHGDGSAELVFPKGSLNMTLQARPQWGFRYDMVESYYEKESLSFQSTGVVRTADGKEIEFSVALNMSREFAARNEIHIAAGNAVDPLVINFAGNVPGLTAAKYSFDIDCDGVPDQISFVEPGSGFLALDLNNDGRVNDGRELFGPNSGNGFSELEAYDSDGNDWIDENDPIFERLRIWMKDEKGNDVLCALGEKGIGAIFLGNVLSQYQLKDMNNQKHGEISASGIYLMESGMAGTIQQIDLMV